MSLANYSRFARPGERRRVVRTIVVLVAMLWMLAAAEPSAAAEAPLPTSLAAEPFSAGAFRVIVDASRDASGVARICIEAFGLTEDGPEFQTAVYEMACPSEMRAESSYRFAPIRRVASISGRVDTVRITERRQRQSGGDWVEVSRATERSSATVDLRWIGHGGAKPEVVTSGFPGSCYSLPPVCMSAGAGVSRNAVVRGSIAFHGIRLTALVPARHPGVMRIGT